mmetsp:Transcript_6790/g.8570  ORF Transcript_6790/g.8570 Transcript_6790/m.8570 type:complete len:92 (+) Transcript_6790:936-1211(+)
MQDTTLEGTGDSPLRNYLGSGTTGAHWDQDVFQTELMTGFLLGKTQQLSIMTVRSPQDLGFEVNTSAVDPYAIPGIQLPTQSPTGHNNNGE